MKLHYTLSKEDFNVYLWYYIFKCRGSRRGRLWATMIMSVGVVLINWLLLTPQDMPAFFTIHGVVVLGLVVYNYLLAPHLMYWIGRRQFHKRHRGKHEGAYTIVFHDQGVAVDAPGMREEVAWEKLDGFDVWKQYVFLYTTKYMALVIPCVDNEEQAAVVQWCTDHGLVAHP